MRLASQDPISIHLSHKDELAELFLVDPDTIGFLTPEFVEGFVDGAKDVWEEIKGKI